MAALAARAALGNLSANSTALLVCDIQERFRPVISGFPAVGLGAGYLLPCYRVDSIALRTRECVETNVV
jgi:hypothetical protein